MFSRKYSEIGSNDHKECCSGRKDGYTVNVGNVILCKAQAVYRNQNIKSIMPGVHKMVKHTLKILHQIRRDVFRILSNIYDGIFCENN